MLKSLDDNESLIMHVSRAKYSDTAVIFYDFIVEADSFRNDKPYGNAWITIIS
jgi:hypothetical protein